VDPVGVPVIALLRHVMLILWVSLLFLCQCALLLLLLLRRRLHLMLILC
jgi:hypothetical protein